MDLLHRVEGKNAILNVLSEGVLRPAAFRMSNNVIRQLQKNEKQFLHAELDSIRRVKSWHLNRKIYNLLRGIFRKKIARYRAIRKPPISDYSDFFYADIMFNDAERVFLSNMKFGKPKQRKAWSGFVFDAEKVLSSPKATLRVMDFLPLWEKKIRFMLVAPVKSFHPDDVQSYLDRSERNIHHLFGLKGNDALKMMRIIKKTEYMEVSFKGPLPFRMAREVWIEGERVKSLRGAI